MKRSWVFRLLHRPDDLDRCVGSIHDGLGTVRCPRWRHGSTWCRRHERGTP